MFEEFRKNMVDGQILPNRVTDPRIINAMGDIPRERFVPRLLRGMAYIDEDLAFGNGRYLPEPVILARMIQAADIKRTDVVLDIGCGTGYSSALLGNIASTVIGIEQDKGMAQEADKLLHDLGIVNAVVVQQKDLREGYPQQGPYDAILINGSVPSIPDKIKSQLANGGRLVTVVSRHGHMGSAVLVARGGENFSTRVLFDASAPRLAGFEQPEKFVF